MDRGGKTMRKVFGCGLGLWHNYKQTCGKLYKKFAKVFFAPMFHASNPNNSFWERPKYLETLVYHFSLIRIAYPSFKAALTAALADPACELKNRTHLFNLQALCEYFIPAVSVLSDYRCVQFIRVDI